MNGTPVEVAAKPLEGRRILVTRPVSEAGSLVEALRGLGAEVLVQPAIEVRALEDFRDLDHALGRLRSYDWVVFTSANGVRHVWERLPALGTGLEDILEDGEDGRGLHQPRLAAIGPGTASALERRGARPDYVPAEYVAEALAAGLPDVEAASVLLLRAEGARPALRELLEARGAAVDDVAAYRTVMAGEARSRPGGDAEPGAGTAASQSTDSGTAPGAIDAVTFTSPSTVRGYLGAAGKVPAGAVVVCIGPVTARAARAMGVRVDAVAETYTVAGLVEALVGHFSRKGR